MIEQIDSDTFSAVDMRVGIVKEATYFNEARKPAYKLLIDFGSLGLKHSSAQITALYRPDELINRKVIAVVNLKPKQIANYLSEVLVLGVHTGGGEVVLLEPERDVQPGLRIS